MARKLKAIFIEDTEDQEERLEQKLEDFLNSMPKKEIVHVSFSSIGIRHVVLIIYKEGS